MRLHYIFERGVKWLRRRGPPERMSNTRRSRLFLNR
jgi:hypothetical protein